MHLPFVHTALTITLKVNYRPKTARRRLLVQKFGVHGLVHRDKIFLLNSESVRIFYMLYAVYGNSSPNSSQATHNSAQYYIPLRYRCSAAAALPLLLTCDSIPRDAIHKVNTFNTFLASDLSISIHWVNLLRYVRSDHLRHNFVTELAAVEPKAREMGRGWGVERVGEGHD